MMFLCAVSRPRHDTKHNCMWDGKVGLWPFVETQLAKRLSKKRERGTPVTVPMILTKPVYRRFLVDKVIPSIQSKLSGRRSDTIFVQHDNARLYVAVNDAEVMAAGKKNDCDIQLKAQPELTVDQRSAIPHLKKDIQMKAGVRELRPSCDEERTSNVSMILWNLWVLVFVSLDRKHFRELMSSWNFLKPL
ncbi:hypothetical protein H257_13070 [Aphanomyces astaci]|uniref:Uncharacterized protein n=1 Tax=Aphanomyces astaci TaxID=112090 RepID=W4FXW3_APHAT|nr:hypothetical protein H257_13070 [Aphanomyces astaci]ETV71609.1 hypothetical protein H257_13070 [Aphanomyces astaci]|eukprot:XP_009838797.1 hypothetical protein H257_13070 [Aphanomyces astaci]